MEYARITNVSHMTKPAWHKAATPAMALVLRVLEDNPSWSQRSVAAHLNEAPNTIGRWANAGGFRLKAVAEAAARAGYDPRGATGARGLPGTAGPQGTPGPSRTTLASSLIFLSANETESAYVSCAGKFVTGGGAGKAFDFSGDILINKSAPAGTTGWNVTVTNLTASPQTVDAYALCTT